MVDSKYSANNYKSLKISIGAITKNQDNYSFLITLKLKRCVKMIFVIRYKTSTI